MSDNKENEPVVSSASKANCANASDASERTLKTKLDLLEKNVEFLLELGQHQDKILKRVTSELFRLSNNTGLKATEPSVDEDSAYKIYVGNLSPTTTKAQICAYFEKFGIVKEFFIARAHETSKNGFVHFRKQNSVNEALSGGPHFLDDRLLVVNKAFGRRRFGKENALNKIDSPLKAGKSTSRSNRYSPY